MSEIIATIMLAIAATAVLVLGALAAVARDETEELRSQLRMAKGAIRFYEDNINRIPYAEEIKPPPLPWKWGEGHASGSAVAAQHDLTQVHL